MTGLLIHVFLASASKWDRPCSPVVYNISSSRHVPFMALQAFVNITG